MAFGWNNLDRLTVGVLGHQSLIPLPIAIGLSSHLTGINPHHDR